MQNSIRFIYQHFAPGRCSNYVVQIIERLEVTNSEVRDTARRVKREAYWIRKLKTKYPYVLNDKLVGEDWKNMQASRWKKTRKIVGKKRDL